MKIPELIPSKDAKRVEEMSLQDIVDGEFSFLETEFSFADSMDLARTLLAEMSGGSLFDPGNFDRQGNLSDVLYKLRCAPDKKSGFVQYELPGMPSGKKGIREIQKERFDDSLRSYAKTETYSFMTGSQGTLWEAPRQENFYCGTSMSTCSTIVGWSEEKVCVGHISYSDRKSTEATLDFCAQNNIPMEHIVVVASIGENGKEYEQDPITDEETYVRYGIPSENILPFHCTYERTDDGKGLYRNITQVLVRNDGLLKWSCDVSFKSMRYAQVLDASKIPVYVDEECVLFE